MADSHKNPEASHKKPTTKDSVDSFIGRKKAEKQSNVAESVSEKMAGTKEGVAEVMGGMEKPKERVSEREGESGEKGDIKAASTGQGDDIHSISAQLKNYFFPSEEVMIKKIRTAINAQIEIEWKKAKKYRRNLNSGGAAGYNRSISRIRQLKEVLASLLTMTVSFLKNMYVRYFTSNGKRREIDAIE